MAKPTAINLNDTTPAAPAGKVNVKWQVDAPVLVGDQPVRAASAYVDAPTRKTTSVTTALLADGDPEVGVAEIASSFTILKVEVSAAARVQLYATAGCRTLDAGREPGILPDEGTPHGVIGDWNLDGTGEAPLEFICSPAMQGANLEGSPSADIAYRITNKSGGAAEIIVTITFDSLES